MLRSEKKQIQIDAKRIVAYLLSQGKQISEVAEIVGIEPWTLYRFIQAEGLSEHMTARHGKRLSENTVAQIKRLLFEEKLSPSEIERRLGLKSRSPIYCLISKMRLQAEGKE